MRRYVKINLLMKTQSSPLMLNVNQGLINNSSLHVGIRAPIIRRKGDVRNDIRCGFQILTARDLDRFGIDGMVERIKDRVGDNKVYISVDIDVLDPSYAPGTPEPTLRQTVVYSVSVR